MASQNSAGQAHNGTRQRVVACRQRLRRARATQRALIIERSEAVLEDGELLAFAGGLADAEQIFAEAGAAHTPPARSLTPEVDRRRGLRAR